MPILLELVESQPGIVPLTDDAARHLAELGSSLASQKEWWGADPEAGPSDRSVIETTSIAPGLWQVRVRDAVGVIVLDGLQLHILPKIPSEHFVFLARRSQRLPRTVGAAGLGTSGPLWELVILWFLDAAEALLRRGILRDYANVSETIPTIRGQLDVQVAARRYYTGSLLFDCTFDDHVEDTAPNRLVKAAAVYASVSPLPDVVRARARRIAARFEGAGLLRAADLTWVPDRRSAHYRAAVSLALHVLRGRGRALDSGAERIWTFLIRTPELIEDGIRAVLQERLGRAAVSKAGVQLPGTSLTFNPDLRFWGASAVADVKYKIASGNWNRSDLYQVLAFAAALTCRDAAVVNFALSSEVIAMPGLAVGDFRVQQLSWPAGAVTPAEAANLFGTAVELWLTGKKVG